MGYDEISVKIEGAHATEAVEEIKQIWDKSISYPFSYTFLDQHSRIYTG